MSGKQLHMAEQCVLMRLGVRLTKGLLWQTVVLDATGRMQRSMLLLIIADKINSSFMLKNWICGNLKDVLKEKKLEAVHQLGFYSSKDLRLQESKAQRFNQVEE